jgi:hypothetical protein
MGTVNIELSDDILIAEERAPNEEGMTSKVHKMGEE